VRPGSIRHPQRGADAGDRTERQLPARGTSRAGRLVYAGSYPEPAQTRSTDEPIGLPGLLFHNDMTAGLDTGWWPRGPTRSSAAGGKPSAGR
jgi:hypothetical protein